MTSRSFPLLGPAFLLLSAMQLPAATPSTPAPAPSKPTIFVCGDSTSKFSGSETQTSEMQGWGTPIAKFFDPEKVKINNVGHAGTSSRTYYGGDWPRVIAQVKPGDYVLIVFGINDGTTMDGIGDQTRAAGARGGARAGRGGAPATTPAATGAAAAGSQPSAPATAVASAPGAAVEHTYGWYMRTMATDVLAKGAHPYFLTVTARDIWTNPKVKFTDATPQGPLPPDYNPSQDKIERGTANGKYTNYTKQVGEMIHVPVFDLTNACADLYEKMGRETVMKFYRDHNHTYAPGAETVARVIASGLKGFKDSPFVGLMSDAGKELPAPDPKYVFDNLAGVASQPSAK